MNCFLCDGPHRVKDCEFLKDLRKLVKAQKRKDKDGKNIKQKQKAYNANDNNSFSDSLRSLDIDFNNEENMKEIAALSKELVSTVPRFN